MKKILIAAALVLCILLFGGCGSEEPLRIVHVTDIHFAGREFHDYEGIFLEINDNNGSGKQMEYLDDILDAFIAEMLSEKPDYILLTGDNTFVGATQSHLLLTEKLRLLAEEGITVLVLPGNHDIGTKTFVYPDGGYEEADSPSPEKFRELYSDFGYSGGISYHADSLSYVYDTGKNLRIFMLDTNFVYGTLFGNLDEGRLEWLEKELSDCRDSGARAIVCGHHNLLDHNEMFSVGYKIGNAPELEEILAEYGADLYLSGHMHTQHIAGNENVTDIVGGAFCVFPHRYGIIESGSSGWNYSSRSVDVEAFAALSGSENPDLLGYENFGFDFFYRNAYSQAYDALSAVITDPDLIEKYADFSARLNVAYFGGTLSEIDLSLSEDFLRDSAGTSWGNYMSFVLRDTGNHTVCSRIPSEE